MIKRSNVTGVLLASWVLVAIGGCQTGVASPGPTGVPPSSPTSPASLEPTAAPTPSRFTSTLYGYSLTLPAGWSAAPALLRWDGTSEPGNEEATIDKFAPPPAGASIWAFAGPVAVDLDQFAQDRIAATRRDHGDTCPHGPEARDATLVGGEPAIFLAWNCGILINEVVTVHDRQGFAFVLRDLSVDHATDPTDRAMLDGLLRTVTLPG